MQGYEYDSLIYEEEREYCVAYNMTTSPTYSDKNISLNRPKEQEYHITSPPDLEADIENDNYTSTYQDKDDDEYYVAYNVIENDVLTKSPDLEKQKTFIVSTKTNSDNDNDNDNIQYFGQFS